MPDEAAFIGQRSRFQCPTKPLSFFYPLRLNNDDSSFTVQCFDVHPIEFVVSAVLIAFAFKNLVDGDFSPKSTVRRPSSTPKFALLRSMR